MEIETIYIIIGKVVVFSALIILALAGMVLLLVIYSLLKKFFTSDAIGWYFGKTYTTQMLRYIYQDRHYTWNTKKGIGKYILKYRYRNIKKANEQDL